MESDPISDFEKKLAEVTEAQGAPHETGEAEDDEAPEAVLAGAVLPGSAVPVVAGMEPSAMAVVEPVPGGGAWSGNVGFALGGLVLAGGVIAWTNRQRLLPERFGGAWLPVGGLGPVKRPVPADLPGARFTSSNPRLAAAVNRLYDKLRDSA